MANVLNKQGAVTSNEIVGNILKVVGFNPRDLNRPIRVGKIIITTDADADGAHILVLLLTIFQQVMPKLLQEGRVYIVNPPLFEAMDSKGRMVAGDSLSEMTKTYGKLTSVNRMKGLGGCEVPLLRQVATDPATRRLLRDGANGCRLLC
jgi:DNA gyrase/topoisomerase IV subunit B